METVRRILANVRKQFKHLNVTQGLLIGALCLLILMTLLLVGLYSSSPTQVALFQGQGATAEDEGKAATFMSQRGMAYKKAADGKVMVAPGQRDSIIAAMQSEQAL